MKRGRVIAQIKTADGKPILKDTPKSNFLKNLFFYIEWALLKVIGSTILQYKEKPQESSQVEEKKKKRRRK